MASDVSTSYMGLRLQNPIIVASSDLTKTAEGMKRCEAAGAGAIVLKSLFEEQFLLESDIPDADYSVYPEAQDYLRSGGLLEYAPARICREIELAKYKLPDRFPMAALRPPGGGRGSRRTGAQYL